MTQNQQAAGQSADATTADIVKSDTPQHEAKKNHSQRQRPQKKYEPIMKDGVPVMPDEDKFKKETESIEKKLNAAMAKRDEIRQKIASKRSAGDKNDQMKSLRAELDEIKREQAELKGEKSKTWELLKSVDESIKQKQAQLQEKEKKLAFRSVEALDAHIAKLQAAVDSATMKIIDEKKTLNDIAMLKRSKKSYAEVSALQNNIRDSRKYLQQIRDQLHDPRMDETNAKMDAVRKKMEQLKQQNSEFFGGLKELTAQREKFQKEANDLYNRKRVLGDKFYGQRNAFRTFEKEQKHKDYLKRKERYEKEKHRREEEEKKRQLQKKKERAEKILEQAQVPAFTSHIQTCKSILRILDPNWAAQNISKEAGPGKESSTKDAAAREQLQDSNGILKPRKVEKPVKGSIIKKDDVSYISLPAKNKKPKATTKTDTDGKLHLHFNVLKDLSFLSIQAPASQAEVSETVKKIKEKWQEFEKNQEAETQKQIEEAKKQIELLEKEEEEAAEKARILVEQSNEFTEQKETNDIADVAGSAGSANVAKIAVA